MELASANVIITRMPYYESLPVVDAVVTYKQSSVDGVSNYTSLARLSLQVENFRHCKGLEENELEAIGKRIDDMLLKHTEKYICES